MRRKNTLDCVIKLTCSFYAVIVATVTFIYIKPSTKQSLHVARYNLV